MSMERCPGCRARLADGPACPRCGCDLTLVRRAEAQARQLIRRALRAWAQGNHPEARACAAASLALEQARAEDAEDLVDAIESVKDALGGEDAPLQAAMNNLADLLYYLES